jgi:protocatechuate 3,4-dioxygenase beta subunit
VQTPPESEGPFYPILNQKDKDFNLTHINGKSKEASGKLIWVLGQVVNTNDEPIENAKIEIWQANATGRYNHPRDPNSAAVDPYFQGWAVVASGKQGDFRFKTIFPGAYPAGAAWIRPPHIHFKIRKEGFAELTTQMYFPGQALNNADLMFKSKSADEQKLLVAERSPEPNESYVFIIRLASK